MNLSRLLFKTANGDGASLSIPKRRDPPIFFAKSCLNRFPCGLFVECLIILTTKKRWVEKRWDDLEPCMTPFYCGKFVVGVKLTSIPETDEKWADDIKAALADAKRAKATPR